MTEAEWLTCEDPIVLLDSWYATPLWSMENAARERKLRLFGAGCVRRILPTLLEGSHLGVEVAEQFADSLVAANALTSADRICLGSLDAGVAAGLAVAWVLAGDSDPVDLTDAYQKREAVQQCHLFRDVTGNPFRPVTFDRAWATDTATTLARQMYDSREFGAMPILADALQDAGCENEDILAHCRDPHATHVRGCWVCDLVLGKA